MRPDALLLTEGGNVKLAPVLGVAERQLPMLTRMHEHEREAREREAEKAAHVAVLEQHRVHVAEAATRAAAARAHLHEVYGGEDNVSETTAPVEDYLGTGYRGTKPKAVRLMSPLPEALLSEGGYDTFHIVRPHAICEKCHDAVHAADAAVNVTRRRR